MTNSPERLCPTCGYKNKPETTVCENCLTPLGNFIRGQITTTRMLNGESELSPAEINARVRNAIPNRGLAIYVVNDDELILLDEEQSELVFGRKTDETIGDIINIGEHDGFVSRRHAKLIRGENGYAFMDLGSSNGTWMGSQRLTPHRAYAFPSGTQFRLGHILIMIHYPVKL